MVITYIYIYIYIYNIKGIYGNINDYYKYHLNLLRIIIISYYLLLYHLLYTIKLYLSKKLGPASNSPDSAFEYEGQMVTVEKYYQLMAVKNPIYQKIGKNGKLKFPELPTINIGNNIYIIYIYIYIYILLLFL